MWGVSIMFITIGAVHYRFRDRLGLIPSREAEKIGFSFWWAGWFMLLWWICASIIQVPHAIKLGVAALGVVWVSLQALRQVNGLLFVRSKEKEGGIRS